MFAELTYQPAAFSALLLLIAGVLVGYALSYPFRSDGEDNSDQARKLKFRTDELETTLREERATYAKLEQAFADHLASAESLEFSSQSMASQLREHQTEQQNLQATLDDVRKRRDELLDELDVERQEKADLVNKLSGSQDQIMSSSDELIAARESLSQLRTQIQSSDATINQLKADLEAQSDTRYRELKKELDDERARYAELQSSQAVADERIAALDSDLDKSKNQYEELSAARDQTETELKKATANLENAEAELERTKSQFAGIQQELDDLRNQENSIGSQYDSANETIAQLREAVETLSQRSYEREQERDLALASLDNEQQQRMALDNMLRHKENLLNKTDQNESALQDAMQTISHLQTNLDQANARLQRTVAEREDTAAELAELKNQYSTASEDIASHQRALEALERQRDETNSLLEVEREKYNQLSVDHEHKVELANQAQQQLGLVESRLRHIEIEHNEAEARLNEDAGQVNYLKTELTQKENLLEQTREQREELLETLNGIRDKAENYDNLKLEFAEHQLAAEAMRADFDITLQELKEARQEASRTSQLEHDIDQYRLATEQMRRVQEDAIVELREEQAKSQSLQAQLSERLESGEQTEEQLKSLKPIKFELTAMQNRLQSTVEQLQRIRQERDDALRAKAAAEQSASQLQSENHVESYSFDESEHAPKVEQLESELDKTRAMLTEARSHLSTTRAQLSQREGLMVTLADQKANESDRLRDEVDETRDELSRQRSMIEQLRQQLADRTETIADLQQDRDEILLQLRNTTPAEQAPPRFAVATSKPDQSLEHHETRGLIYTEAPEHQDDLKLISGIAEKLEARLNEFGIYTYEQIMNWDPQAVEEFCRLLTFRDRIERDDWIGQSRQLYAAKYGEQKRIA